MFGAHTAVWGLRGGGQKLLGARRWVLAPSRKGSLNLRAIPGLVRGRWWAAQPGGMERGSLMPRGPMDTWCSPLQLTALLVISLNSASAVCSLSSLFVQQVVSDMHYTEQILQRSPCTKSRDSLPGAPTLGWT